MSSRDKINARNDSLKLAQQILAGEIGLLLGVRRLLPNLFFLGLDNHPDFIVFKGIDSQEDHLPVGPECKNWDKDALMKKDPEINEAETFHRENVFEGCRALIVYLPTIEL
jgi:hypothetical protein